MAQMHRIFIAGLFCVYALPSAATAPGKPSELFELTKVWTAHLKFTPDQWRAMEPPVGRSLFSAGGPAAALVATFLRAADGTKDGNLSRGEFSLLADRWFTAWEKENTGELSLEQFTAGLTHALGGRASWFSLVGDEGGRNGLAASLGIEFTYVRADLEFEGRTFHDVAVRYKGNGTFLESRGTLKRSFKIDLGKFLPGQSLAGVSKLNLHNCVTDASWMNEVLAHKLFREAGAPAPRTAYARVFVTVPGKFDRQYFGLYSLVENVDERFAGEMYGTSNGAIFKPVIQDVFTDLGDEWDDYRQIYDPKTRTTLAQRLRLIAFCKLVSHAEDAEFAERLGEFVDLDNFSRFLATTVWLSAMDSLLVIGQNFYLHLHPTTNQFQFIPWDLDHSFGQFPFISAQAQHNLSIHKPWQGQKRFLERAFQVEAFRKLYLTRMEEFHKSIFSPQRFYQQVDTIAAVIRSAVQQESELKLERFDKVVAGEAVLRTGLGFSSALKPIKGFVVERAVSVKDQLEGKSNGYVMPPTGFGIGDPSQTRNLARTLFAVLDENKDSSLTRGEFATGFAKWFEAWDTDQSGALTQAELRAGIHRVFSPRRGGRGFQFPDPPLTAAGPQTP